MHSIIAQLRCKRLFVAVLNEGRLIIVYALEIHHDWQTWICITQNMNLIKFTSFFLLRLIDSTLYLFNMNRWNDGWSRCDYLFFLLISFRPSPHTNNYSFSGFKPSQHHFFRFLPRFLFLFVVRSNSSCVTSFSFG